MISPLAYHQMLQKKPSRKYGNKPCDANGYKFDSLKERRYYYGLLQRQQTGYVSDIEVHPRWAIIINGKHVCFVEGDFAYLDHRHQCKRVIDVKGRDNAMSKLKRKLLHAVHGVEMELA